MTTAETQEVILKDLISRLAHRLKREPTEDEVLEFIMGDTEERTIIWNKVNEENN